MAARERDGEREDGCMPRVSIIVPVYNAGDELKRCVDSILTQEYQDFELFLMDDGSTDSSPRILDEYAEQDERVRVYHKENSGVSDTRNQAMRLARGEYIQFVDADDWISSDSTKLMVRAMQESGADMVIADFYRVIGERLSRKGDIDEEGVITRKDYADEMLEDPADFYYGVLWNKLYRRDILEKYHLEMDVNLNWCEDFIFNMEYVLHCGTIRVLKAPVYYYVRTEGSLVNQNSGLGATVRMKKNVIQYYSAFYRNIYGTAEYATRRPQIYGFLLDFARDGGVIPFAPGTKRLGDESVSAITDPGLGRNVLTDHYYENKLLEYYLTPITLQNEIKSADAGILLYLRQIGRPASAELLMELTGLTRSGVSSSIQRLRAKKFVVLLKPEKDRTVRSRAADKQGKRRSEKAARAKEEAAEQDVIRTEKALKTGEAEKEEKPPTLYALAAPTYLEKQLDQVLMDYDRLRFDGFSGAEREQFQTLESRSVENIRAFFAVIGRK